MGVYLNSKKTSDISALPVRAVLEKFLSVLLKDQPYVEMVYMTGILPIAKYSSGSEPNMFCEYTMVTEENISSQRNQGELRDRKYVLRFNGKPGQRPEYTGRVLAVGIAYNKKDSAKRHECKVEVLRDKLL